MHEITIKVQTIHFNSFSMNEIFISTSFIKIETNKPNEANEPNKSTKSNNNSYNDVTIENNDTH